MSQDEYNRKYDGLTDKFNELQDKADALGKEKQSRKHKADIITNFMVEIEKAALLPINYSDELFCAFVDHATINSNDTVTFTFKNGAEITVRI